MKSSKSKHFVTLPHGDVPLHQKMPEILKYFKDIYNHIDNMDGSVFSIKMQNVTIWFKAKYINGNKTGSNKIGFRVSNDRSEISSRTSRNNSDRLFEVRETRTFADGSSKIDLASIDAIGKLIATKYKKQEDERQKLIRDNQFTQMMLIGKVTANIDSCYTCTNLGSTDVSIKIGNEAVATVSTVRTPGYIDIYFRPSYITQFKAKIEDADSFLKKINSLLEYAM